MPPSNLDVQSFAPHPIDRPIHFESGPFVGQCIRAQLDELQKADVGRKCGNRDRRPLDPPPVVRLRLFETINEGTSLQAEYEITDVKSEAVAYGFMCFVDLFPWPPPNRELGNEVYQQTERPPSPQLQITPRSEWGPVILPSLSSIITGLDDETDSAFSASSMAEHSTPTSGAFERPPAEQAPKTIDPALVEMGAPFTPGGALLMGWQQQQPERYIAAIVNGIPIPEAAKCTASFVGSTVVQGACFPYEGFPSMLFAFSDLACNIEGTFLIRYRVTNIFSSARESIRMPVIAECWGGPLIVYSTKSFPGLAESTELTKYLSRLGVPVNIRQGERKKRARRRDESPEGGPSGCAR